MIGPQALSLVSPIRLQVNDVATRVLDVVGALALLVLFAPLMLVISAVLALQRGPVIYSQLRVGQGGRLFRCYKFRTMQPGAEEVLPRLLADSSEQRRLWLEQGKLPQDPRVTWLGRVLRPMGLDELPQLWNVLRGQMSLVGPRPLPPEQLRAYQRYGAYLAVRPGLTGVWQIAERSRLGWRDRVRMDTDYVRRKNILLDLLILLRTVPVVAARRL